ncbi:MAG: hypothetical protein AAB613_03005 [Patescibacteria group bacterium]
MDLNEMHSEHEHATTSLKVVLLVFAIVLVGALAYLVWAANTAPDTTDNSPAVTNTTKPTTTNNSSGSGSTANDMADWKTYTNSTIGFSFKYPPKTYTSSKEGTDKFILYAEEDGQWQFHVDWKKTTNNIATEVMTYLQTRNPNSCDYTETPLKVGGVEAKKIVLSHTPGNKEGCYDGAGYGNTRILSISNGNLLTIAYEQNTELAIKEKVVSTFAFSK